MESMPELQEPKRSTVNDTDRYRDLGFESCDFESGACDGCNQTKPLYFGDKDFFEPRDGRYLCAECLDSRREESKAYGEFLDEQAKHCRCVRGICAGVLAGGPCDGFDEEWETSQKQDEEDECGPTVYCHACSVAGGANLPIYHSPPECSS